MNRVDVDSSNILSIGYDPDSQVLEIEFKDGSIYSYLKVPPNHYDGIMNADSHGKYLNENIKGIYEYERT